MSGDYLLKTEPSEYSFESLQHDETTVWDGVSNPVALRNLSEMKPGARLVIYETADRKSAVGTASVVSVDTSDPKNPAVTIKSGRLSPSRYRWPRSKPTSCSPIHRWFGKGAFPWCLSRRSNTNSSPAFDFPADKSRH